MNHGAGVAWLIVRGGATVLQGVGPISNAALFRRCVLVIGQTVQILCQDNLLCWAEFCGLTLCETVAADLKAAVFVTIVIKRLQAVATCHSRLQL